jgi:hypothetical protein
MTSSSAPQSPLAKRCSDAKKARREQRNGRSDNTLEMTFEFRTECGVDVCVGIIVKDGEFGHHRTVNIARLLCL